jgi:hypothetical protein
MVVLENRDASHTYIRPSGCSNWRCSTSSQFKISYHPQLSTILEENEQEDHHQNNHDDHHKVSSYSFRSSSSVESISLFHHDHNKYSRSMQSLQSGLSTMIEAASAASAATASTTTSFTWDDASSSYNCMEERRGEDSLFSWGLYIEDIEIP